MTLRKLPAPLQDGWPFLAAVTVIQTDGALTAVEPCVGRMCFKDGILCWWPSGMSVAADPRDEVRVDEAARPGWMAPERTMTGFTRVGCLRVDNPSWDPGMDDFYTQGQGGDL